MEFGADTSSVDNEYDVFLKKFISFKQEHLKLQKLHRDIAEENKVLRSEIQVLENRLKIEENNQTSSEIIKQQEVILEFLKKKDDYIDMKNLCDTLQQKVQSLQTQLQTDRSFYEKEIRNILEKTSKQVTEIQEVKEAEANKKIHQLETNYQDLCRKNTALNVILETVGIESENEIARLNSKYEEDICRLKESKIRLESENRILIEKLVQQEKLFKGRLELLEKQNKGNLQNEERQNRKRSFSVLQTLEEAFSANEDECNSSFRSPIASCFPYEDRLLTPYITDETFVEHE